MSALLQIDSSLMKTGGRWYMFHLLVPMMLTVPSVPSILKMLCNKFVRMFVKDRDLIPK